MVILNEPQKRYVVAVLKEAGRSDWLLAPFEIGITRELSAAYAKFHREFAMSRKQWDRLREIGNKLFVEPPPSDVLPPPEEAKE